MFVYVCVCMCVFGEPQGPNLMSYLCAFLTRAQRSAHGTVIPGHGWPCWAARLCRLLYLWHHHHHHHALCLCVSMGVYIHKRVHSRRAGVHSGSKYCVYQHNESSERETVRAREKGERERLGWRKSFSFCYFHPPLCDQPLWCLFLLQLPFPLYFPAFCFVPLFSWPDQH